MSNFWSIGQNTPAIPKRNFRFLVSLGNADGELPVWIAKSTALPQITVGEAKVHFVNHEFKYPGKVTYADLSITLIEAVNPNTSAQLLKLFSDSNYKTPDKISDNPETNAQSSVIFKHKAVETLGDVALTHLGSESDATNNVYTLKNAWIKNITLPGSLDYSNQEVSDVKITFAYDWFTMKPGKTSFKDGFAFADQNS